MTLSYISDETVKHIKIILKDVCGANDVQLEQLYYIINEYNRKLTTSVEYRFQGSLGFGGKLYIDDDGKMRVSCYSEDETPERIKMIDNANTLLFFCSCPSAQS